VTESHLGNTTHFIVIKEHVELSDGDAEICLVKLVWDVPAEGTKLTPLLDNTVEEAQPKQ